MLGWLFPRVAGPFFENDGEPLIKLDREQKQVAIQLSEKLKAGIYKEAENRCLCRNGNVADDVIIACKDRYAIPVKNVLCKNCGLIRRATILDDRSTEHFYSKEYRVLHKLSGSDPVKNYFQKQQKRGEGFLKLLDQLDLLHQIKSVLEIGCGAGGVLHAMSLAGMSVIGWDYDDTYLDYGKNRGLDLIHPQSYKGGTHDLVVLSHVMEHFNHQPRELLECVNYVAPEKFILIEVPGLFWDKKGFNPFTGLQGAHVISYYFRDFLNQYYKTLGMTVLYGDERCTFLLRKPKEWNLENIDYKGVVAGKDWAEKSETYLKKKYIQNNVFPFNYMTKLRKRFF